MVLRAHHSLIPRGALTEQECREMFYPTDGYQTLRDEEYDKASLFISLLPECNRIEAGIYSSADIYIVGNIEYKVSYWDGSATPIIEIKELDNE